MKVITQNEHLTQEGLEEYLRGQVSLFNKRRIDRHLLNCSLCFDHLKLLREKGSPESKENHSKLKKAA